MADEGYYLKYASAIANKGLSEFRNLFTDYVGHEENWVFPNPLRVGLIFISAIWCRIFGNSFVALAYLSFLSYLLLIIINYLFCSKIFGRDKATLLAFLVAFSPLNMAMSRRALSDSLTTLFLLMSIWLFLDMIDRDNSVVKKIIFVLIFSFTILIKETSALLVIPFFVFMIIYQSKFKGKIRLSDFLYLLVYPAIIVSVIYLISAGSIFKIIEVGRVVSTAVKTNSYAILYGSGSGLRYIIDYLLLSPWVLILTVGYLFYMILHFDDSEISEVYFSIVLLVSLFMFSFLTKNIRYIMVLDLPLRLFSILMLKKLFEKRFSKHAVILLVFSVLAICVFDYFNFEYLFLKRDIYDPVTFLLLEAKHIIP
jgi:4-amino-4-deoxy-L-arabinose transferase-like glycosyltransferase